MTALSTVPLSTLGDIVTGSTPPAANPEWFAGGGMPFVTPSDIQEGVRSVRTSRFLSNEGAAALDKRVLPANAVCFVSIGSTIGKMCTTTGPSVTNQQINSLVVDEAIADPTFVYYAISQHAAELKAMAGGSATPILNKSAFSGVTIDVLPIEAQRPVGALLGAMDDKIESNQRVVQVASDLLDAVSAEASDTLGVVRLGDLVTVARTAVDPKALGDAAVDHFSLPAFDEGALPEQVRASTIMSGKLAVSGPNILVSRLNPRFNRTWWAVPTDSVPALASTEFACLTTENREDLAAVWLAVRDEYFRAELGRRAAGTSGSHQRVRPDDLLAIEVPDVRALSRSAKVQALVLIDFIHGRRIESVKLARLRDTLLPELLSGRIRVPEAREALAETAVSV